MSTLTLKPKCAILPDQAAEAGAREKVRVTPAQTLAHMTQLIMPQHANSLGITFGGQVRALSCALVECPSSTLACLATCAACLLGRNVLFSLLSPSDISRKS